MNDFAESKEYLTTPRAAIKWLAEVCGLPAALEVLGLPISGAAKGITGWYNEPKLVIYIAMTQPPLELGKALEQKQIEMDEMANLVCKRADSEERGVHTVAKEIKNMKKRRKYDFCFLRTQIYRDEKCDNAFEKAMGDAAAQRDKACAAQAREAADAAEKAIEYYLGQ